MCSADCVVLPRLDGKMTQNTKKTKLKRNTPEVMGKTALFSVYAYEIIAISGITLLHHSGVALRPWR